MNESSPPPPTTTTTTTTTTTLRIYIWHTYVSYNACRLVYVYKPDTTISSFTDKNGDVFTVAHYVKFEIFTDAAMDVLTKPSRKYQYMYNSLIYAFPWISNPPIHNIKHLYTYKYIRFTGFRFTGFI